LIKRQSPNPAHESLTLQLIMHAAVLSLEGRQLGQETGQLQRGLDLDSRLAPARHRYRNV
jgi:hypothetical protein